MAYGAPTYLGEPRDLKVPSVHFMTKKTWIWISQNLEGPVCPLSSPVEACLRVTKTVSPVAQVQPIWILRGGGQNFHALRYTSFMWNRTLKTEKLASQKCVMGFSFPACDFPSTKKTQEQQHQQSALAHDFHIQRGDWAIARRLP
jgi:hypothetical protein